MFLQIIIFEVFLADFLKLYDTGINGIYLQKEKLDKETHLRNMPDNLKKEILNEVSSDNVRGLFVKGPSESFIIRRNKNAKSNDDLVYLRLQ